MERSKELSMDQSFLQKLTEAVFTNLNNEQFGAKELAKEVGLSRSQIHRNLHKINGKSATQFVREIRLEEAHKLLQNEIGTAAEIAYQVGFSSPTYFSTCFHEYFGYTPGEVKYRKIAISNNKISYDSQQGKKRKIDYRTKKLLLATTFVLILFFALTAMWYLNRDSKIDWAKGQALVEIEQYLNTDKSKAYQVALKAEKYNSRDPKFINLLSQVSSYISIVTDPPGADIYAKAYKKPESEWEFLGKSPIESVRLPQIFFQWKMEKEGYETVYAVAITRIDTLHRKLDEKEILPPEMVRVTGGNTDQGIALPDFFIDKYEVTNQQFKAFVIAGGYQKQAYWKHEFTKDGRKLNWGEAMKEFHDTSGRPGPSTWQGGDYPDGQDKYPVSGISWYEAAAFAKFVGKSLPSTHHWSIANGFNLRYYKSKYLYKIASLSNFNGKGPEIVGSFNGMNCFGAYDLAGNVKEWCWNETKMGRSIRGGAWNDADYMYIDVSQLPSFDRSPKNGFRCVQYIERDKIPEKIFQPKEYKEYRDYYNEKPVSDDVFEVFMNRFLYDSVELDANIYEIDDSFDDWTLEKITFNAAYGNERIIAFLYLPKNVLPPYQTVIYFPGGGVLRGGSIEDNHRHLYNRLEFMIKNGRAVLSPVYYGTWERSDPDIHEIYYPNESHAHTEFMIKLIKDFSISIDYLESRSDIDCNKLAYFGHSWGGRLGATILAIEKRIKVGILHSGGLPMKERARSEVDVINFISRVKIPVLMLNGKYDHDFVFEISVKPMYDLLGTPEADKKLKTYETDHFVPKNELIKETLYWLDNYLGSVEQLNNRTIE